MFCSEIIRKRSWRKINIFRIYMCMIILSTGYKMLCGQLSFWCICRIYILLQLLLMVVVAIELLYLVGLMGKDVEQCCLV